MAPVVHLGAIAPSAPAQSVPVRVRLGLAELTVLADRVGTRLPLDVDQPGEEPDGHLESRLSGGTPTPSRQGRSRVREALVQAREHPASCDLRLRELGLVDGSGAPVGEVVAALRRLAAPEALLVLDLTVTGDGTGHRARLRSWFAVSGAEVVQLSTSSGLTYELAWFAVDGLYAALARAATVADAEAGTEGDDDDPVDLATPLRLPFELFTDGTEAVRRDRPDILAELVRIAPGPVLAGGAELAPGAVAEVVTLLERAGRGRLRVLVTVGQDDGQRRTAGVAGVVSWLRVGDGWRSLTPSRVDDVPTLTLDAVEPHHLGRAVAPVLAELLG